MAEVGQEIIAEEVCSDDALQAHFINYQCDPSAEMFESPHVIVQHVTLGNGTSVCAADIFCPWWVVFTGSKVDPNAKCPEGCTVDPNERPPGQGPLEQPEFNPCTSHDYPAPKSTSVLFRPNGALVTPENCNLYQNGWGNQVVPVNADGTDKGNYAVQLGELVRPACDPPPALPASFQTSLKCFPIQSAVSASAPLYESLL